jgi:phenylacetate-coenzyme A ligase PaaK-like adenylate-forming protein
VVAPPLRDLHPDTWALLGLESIYEPSPERDDLFVSALREITRWHLDRNPPYRAYCHALSFDPDRDLRQPEDLPPLSADLFKVFDLVTLRHVDYFTVSSSGTGGRRTTIPLDLETVLRMWAMGEASFEEEGLASETPVDYVVLAPDPALSPDHGNAHFFAALMEAAPARERIFALVPDGAGGLRLDTEKAARRIDRSVASGRVVRIVGLPSLIARLAESFGSGPVRLDPESLVLTGGGWKKETRGARSKESFRALVGRAWGVPAHRVRDLYGMTEHAVHYVECREHRFHAPVYSRVRVVDPLSGALVEKGRDGVLHLLNPGFTTMPFQSLRTDDVGRDADPCPCGRRAPAFEVLGRGGTSLHRGCAATTLERLAS